MRAMDVTGTVIDEVEDLVLPGASIRVVDAAGKALGPGTAADDAGEFYLDSDKLSGNYLLFSHVGHSAVMAPAVLFDGYDYPIVALPKYSDELDEVVITPKKKNNAIWWILLVAVIVLNK